MSKTMATLIRPQQERKPHVMQLTRSSAVAVIADRTACKSTIG